MPISNIVLIDTRSNQATQIARFNVTNDYVLKIVHRCLRLNSKGFPTQCTITNHKRYNTTVVELTKLIIWLNHELPDRIKNKIVDKPLLLSANIKKIIENDNDPLAPRNFINNLIDTLYQYPSVKLKNHSIADFGEAMTIVYNIAIQLHYKKIITLELN